MSFDINPPNKNLSNIQASSKTSDGGAGNTGYFQRGQKSKEEEKKFGITFSAESELDSFEHENSKEEQIEEQESFSFVRFIEIIISKIKNFIFSIFNSKKAQDDQFNKNA